jgi:hypothetical protein
MGQKTAGNFNISKILLFENPEIRNENASHEPTNLVSARSFDQKNEINNFLTQTGGRPPNS